MEKVRFQVFFFIKVLFSLGLYLKGWIKFSCNLSQPLSLRSMVKSPHEPMSVLCPSNLERTPYRRHVLLSGISTFRELKIDLKYVLANSVNKNLTQITRLGCKKFLVNSHFITKVTKKMSLTHILNFTWGIFKL